MKFYVIFFTNYINYVGNEITYNFITIAFHF